MWLASIILSAIGLLSVTLTGDERSHCVGGSIIYFERGSTEIGRDYAQDLDDYARFSVRLNADSAITIESGGDGTAGRFDPNLSRQRSEAIRSFLVARGVPASRITIAVQSEFGREQPNDSVLTQLHDTIAHVQERVTWTEFLRHFQENQMPSCS